MTKIVFVLSFLLASLAQAATTVSGSASGIWTNPLPATSFSGVNSSTFSWGVTLSPSVPNLLTFSSVAGGFSGFTETPFKIGSLFYQNGTVNSLPTPPTSVNLALTLDFTSPDLPAFVNNFTFSLLATSNTSDANASADIVLLPTTFSTTSFTIGNTEYFVKLTGFQNVVGDGFLVSSGTELHVREGLNARADLYALITSNTLTPPVVAVPEPDSYAMLLVGLGLIGLIARKRQNLNVC